MERSSCGGLVSLPLGDVALHKLLLVLSCSCHVRWGGRRSLPPMLKRSVQDYFHVRMHQRAICDEEEILRQMSPSLKAQVRLGVQAL
jgi:hypothetical protein